MPRDADELLPTRWSLIQRLKNWDDQETWREFFNLYWKLIFGMARLSTRTGNVKSSYFPVTAL